MFAGKWGGGGICAETGYPLKLPSPTNLARLGHFTPASQAGRLAGPVFYVYVFFLGVKSINLACQSFSKNLMKIQSAAMKTKIMLGCFIKRTARAHVCGCEGRVTTNFAPKVAFSWKLLND